MSNSAAGAKLRQNVKLVAVESSTARDNLVAAGFGPKGLTKTTHAVRRGLRSEAHSAVSRQLDVAIDRGIALRTRRQGTPFAARIRPRENRPYDNLMLSQFVESCEQSFGQINELFSSLTRRTAHCVEAAESITQAALIHAAEDLDLFVSLGINPPGNSYPSRHSLHVGMLAMSIGAVMGWDERTLLDLGIGCLIHDAGMQEVHELLFQEPRVLTSLELIEIMKHPLHTFDMIDRELDRVPPAARMVAYQLHERCDGSGYPRGRRGPQIHPLAKIAAVADVFVALVSPRPYRPAMMSYYAMEHVLHGVRDGLFDADVVRAMLKTVSLFPLGSRVSLSDGRVGTVIRANPKHYDRPVVEIAEGRATPAVIDLSRQTNLRVVRPLSE